MATEDQAPAKRKWSRALHPVGNYAAAATTITATAVTVPVPVPRNPQPAARLVVSHFNCLSLFNFQLFCYPQPLPPDPCHLPCGTKPPPAYIYICIYACVFVFVCESLLSLKLTFLLPVLTSGQEVAAPGALGFLLLTICRS